VIIELDCFESIELKQNGGFRKSGSGHTKAGSPQEVVKQAKMDPDLKETKEEMMADMNTQKGSLGSQMDVYQTRTEAPEEEMKTSQEEIKSMIAARLLDEFRPG
jgi:hypothetical protein